MCGPGRCRRGLGTENMRVMKMVRRFGSLDAASLASGRGRSAGGFEGVKDLARPLFLRKLLSMRPYSCSGLDSSGTMCILFELPRYVMLVLPNMHSRHVLTRSDDSLARAWAWAWAWACAYTWACSSMLGMDEMEAPRVREEMLPRPQGALLWVTSAVVVMM